MLQKWMRFGHDIAELTLRFWMDARMFPTPQRKCGVGDRMAALSLRVVEGGRR
jgi:hypothetical protein